MMALVIAMAMILSTMSVVTFAAAGDLSADGSISVSGIDKGDKVTVYQFVTWEDGNWKVNENAGITLEELTNGLTQAELGTIAQNASSFTKIAENVEVGDNGTYTNNTVNPGSFLVLIQDVNNDTIYNPIVVSNDYDPQSPNTVALTDNMANAKKEPVDVTKTVDNRPDDYDVQVGDEVPFTVESNVPTYNTNWTDPMFQISDTLSSGLTLKAEPTVTVEGYTIAKDTDYTLTKGTAGADGYTVKFSTAFLQRVTGNPKMTIKYTAVVGEAVKDNAQVHEETNKVKLEFSNNPNDSSSHGEKNKETHHYTFAIDATRLGSESEKTTELIKVGIDKNGEPITVKKESDALPTQAHPLAGAEFTLTGTGANNTGTVTLTATSDSDGRISFNNLEVGTYTLQETKAPAGYIKDPDTHTVVITAEYNEDTTLKNYTIKIDGQSTSTYTASTKDNGSLDTITANENNQSFPINNKKGAELPSTGGIGTTIFYVVGSLLVLAAGILLVTRRRMRAE